MTRKDSLLTPEGAGSVSTGRHPDHPLEKAREMALVAEAGEEGDLGDGSTVPKERCGPMHANLL
jgi:hypothetical protein